MAGFWDSLAQALEHPTFLTKSSSSHPVGPPPPLQAQYPTPAAPSTKIRLTLLSTALVDALGGPAEFHKRFSFPLITSMIPNKTFYLPPGVWTDDTSMTLCLARSLATYTPRTTNQGIVPVSGGFDEKHQLEAYINWQGRGVRSATGECFDIGNTIQRALRIYAQCSLPDSPHTPDQGLEQICMALCGESCAGNGSLMRVVPVGLSYWRNANRAMEYARRSSKTTHPNGMCIEACEVWTGAIVQIMQETSGTRQGMKRFSKLDLLAYFSSFIYTNAKLRDALAVPSDAPPPPTTDPELEEYYRVYHPLLHLISETQPQTPQSINPTIPPAQALPSTGYVLHTLTAALYCFLATQTFEEGAIMAVNLGDDADTVGAVYAGLAGCWYANDGTGDDGFWSPRVREWRKNLVRRDLVEAVADELVRFSEGLA